MRYLAQSDLWRLNNAIRPAIKPQPQDTTIITNGQSRVLGTFRQIFPLTLFRDNLIIEELRIIHVKKDGPWISEVISIMATDIACVNSTSGMFFGSVHILSLTGGPEICVNNLTRGDVQTIRSLVEGIALASREGLKIDQGKDLDLEKQNFLNAGAIHYG